MIMRKELKAVVFDMDGVILDSERALMEIWEQLAEEIPMPNIREVYASVCGTTREITGEIMREAYGQDFPFEELNRRVYEMRDEKYREGLPLKPGISQLLIFLKENRIKTALATSTRRSRAFRQLEAVGLLSYFDECVTGDMVEHSKPDPEIFNRAIDLLQVSSDETAVIEDSFNGVRAARKSGAEVIMVPDLKQPDEEIRSLCDECFPSLFEVLGYVKKRIAPVFS